MSAKKVVASPDRISSVKAIYDSLRLKYGQSVRQIVSDKDFIIPHIATGFPSLDNILSIGGIPKRRLITFWGPEACGKTNAAIQVMVALQKAEKTPCAFIDTEHAFEPSFMKKLGVNFDLTIIEEPVNGEAAVNFTIDALESGIKFIILDSIAAMTPEALLTSDAGQSHVGNQAKLVHTFCRQVVPAIKRNNATVIVTNHLRSKIATGKWLRVSVDDMPGGRGLWYASSLMIRFIPLGFIKDGSGDNAKKVGRRILLSVNKYKVGPPFMETQLNLINNIGFDRWADMFEVALDKKLIKLDGRKLQYEQYISKPIVKRGSQTGAQFHEFLLSMDKTKAQKLISDLYDKK